MYLVVFFKEENSVEGVPKSWVLESADGKTYCYWPSEPKKYKVSKLVKDLAPFCNTWKLYPCIVKAEASNYQTMLIKTKEAEIATTEAPSSSNDEHTPIKQRKQVLISDSDESDVSPQK